MADATPSDPSEQKRLGDALRSLRESLGMTQAEAADRVRPEPVTPQAWQNYEAGARRWREDLVRRVTGALGLEPADLYQERARLEGQAGVRAFRSPLGPRYELPIAGVVRAGALASAAWQAPAEPETLDVSRFLGPTVRVLLIQGESMIPYAQPGGFVTYDTRTWPRRGDGCVITFRDGRDPLVKRFERTLGDTLYVTELYPEERELTFPMAEVEGVYRVGFRAD